MPKPDNDASVFAHIEALVAEEHRLFDHGELNDEQQKRLARVQSELDRYWDALLQGGGKPQACGWLIDRYGLRWQIVPALFDEWMNDTDTKRSKRFTDAMLKMVKFDIAALEKAYCG